MDVSNAWIGVIGGAIGALAGLCGAWLTVFMTSRSQRRNEIREAAVNLIAKAGYPELARKALARGSLDGDRLFILASEWAEDLARARARLAILAPAELQSMGDFLWQRADDQMNALLDGEKDVESLGSEVSLLAFQLEEITGRKLGHRRRRLTRGID